MSLRSLSRGGLLGGMLALGLGLGVLILSPGAVGKDVGAERSDVIYPPQEIPLTFNHQRHIEQGARCQLCHASIESSDDVRDRNLPDHSVCGICHQMQVPNAAELYPAAACATCHRGYTDGGPEHLGPDKLPLANAPPPAPVVFPPARITFSHAVHVPRGIPCLTCHEGVDQVALATREHLPAMGVCLDCHDGGTAPSECTTCHLQGDGGRVLTDFEEHGLLKPSGRFRPDDHDDPRWLHVHRTAAKVDEASCSSCHEAADCLACHDGTVEPGDLHPADWVMTHGLEAQRRTLDCQACHEVETDCQSCHTEAEIVRGPFPGGPGSEQEGPLRFHPEGWAGIVGEIPGAEHHSHIARRSLETCEACHGGADEAMCLDCHGTIVSPHPASWGDPDVEINFGQGEGSVCLRCHQPGDPDLDRMRR